MPQSTNQTAPGGAPILTYFAPPERASESEMAVAKRLIADNPLFRILENSIDGFLMILNPQRQVLAVNMELLKALGLDSSECLLGERPGEVINCVQVKNGPGGCGTAPACSECGAVVSILTSQNEGRIATGECLATVRNGDYEESLEFRVRAAPLEVGGCRFTVLVFNDISGDKRRQALERTFFHDILNTVGGLMGLSALLTDFEGLDQKEVAERIVVLSKKLAREIQDQRKLTQAETGALELDVAPASVQEILDDLRATFEANDVAKNKMLLIDPPRDDRTVLTDASLLGRILTNMTKNALEAVQQGETVEVWHEARDGKPCFFVRNPGRMPEAVAKQIFKRSFSTKSKMGRGIGTYSMKLFGERYLEGKVAFETNDKTGTTFRVELPAEGPSVPDDEPMAETV